jgi:NAD(P)-dependent dehydrogenase (short-subunit alcohol dehydrogenase family)
MRTWFITGANRGLGLEVAKAALNSGDQLVATARDPSTIPLSGFAADRVLMLALDVTDSAAVAAAVDFAMQKFGRIDVLVNNAGYGQLGAFEEISSDAIERQFATNVFGVFAVTRAVLTIMRKQRSGHVITIASIAGMVGFDGSSIYCSTKHAVSGWSEGLSKEVAPFGIKVTCIYPGRFRTDFLDGSSLRYGDLRIDDYVDTSAARRLDLDADNHRQIGNPLKFGDTILTLANASEPPVWLATGSDAYAVFVNKASALRDNAEEWKTVTLSTDFATT